jgi:SAM-dependent methyltransferase
MSVSQINPKPPSHGTPAPAPAPGGTGSTADAAKAFYNKQFQEEVYTPFSQAESHSALPYLKAFVEQFGLADKKVVEVGCGRGAFQDLVADYTGVDYASSVRSYIRKPFVEASATALPFADSAFDAAWTVWTLEHVPNPEQAFQELRRVIKPGGALFLGPAWNCRSWNAKGYPVRPYSDFDLWGKLVKASIPLRDSGPYKIATRLPGRLRRALEVSIAPGKPTTLRYGKLTPDWDHFWMADSDAVNAIDPFEAAVWFTSRGDECISHPTLSKQLAIRTGFLVFRIRK